MTYTSVEVYSTFLHSIEDRILADEGGARLDCSGCNRSVWGTDDADAKGGIDSMGEA